MRPISKNKFGPNSDCLSIRFHNGDTFVNGYVYRQIGTSRYVVSDGTQLLTVTLASTTGLAKIITGESSGDISSIAGLATVTGTQAGTTYYLSKLTSKLAHTTTGRVDRWKINTAPAGEILISGVSAITLKTISMSSMNYKAGDAFNVYMRGITPGSTVTATSSDGTPLTISGLFVRGTFSTLGTPTISFTETLGDAMGSPKSSSYQVNVNPTDALVTLTIDPTTATMGRSYFGAVQGKTAGSTISATSSDGTLLTVYGGMVTGVFKTPGSKTLTLLETLNGRTFTSTVTVTV